MRCRSHKLQQLIELLLVIDFCRRANHPYEGHIKNDKIKKILKLYENLT